jgi:antitoxin CptB
LNSILPPLRGKVPEGRKGGVAPLTFARYSTVMGIMDARRRRALFRAQRRGIKELDLVFGAFAEAHLPVLDETSLARFEAFLDVPEWRMFGWIMGHEDVPDVYDNDVLALLRAYRPQNAA